MKEVIISESSLSLLPEKAIWWKERSVLFLADLHFGKTSHFRKEGIAIPGNLIYKDFKRLHDLLKEFKPKEIYILGDLFHSDYNAEWNILNELVEIHSRKKFHLIIGNHDILAEERYLESGFEVHHETMELYPFILSHEPLKVDDLPLYNLSGHIHPGILIKGKGRQSLRFPCFFFAEDHGILPAFGTFTGLKLLRITETQRAFVIVENEIIDLGHKFSQD